jgi:hypothetical protein
MVIKIKYTALILVFSLLCNNINALTFKKKKTVKQDATSIVKETVTPKQIPGPFDYTISPEIPEQVEFCGKTIKLDRYDLKERYDRELLAMLYMHSSSLLLIKRANRYFPVIEPILKANGIPDDMKYLACIESHLDYKALSSAKAVGMWQFMPETAKEYGLVVNDEVDERYNIERSTEAACRYLKYAYSLYGDWATAAVSYNTGYARVSRELLRQRAATGLDLWLVDETMRYFFRIVTCKDFMNNPKKYGFMISKETLYPPFLTKDTIVGGKVPNWIDFADSLGVTFYDLKYFNTWIRSDSLVNIDNNSYKVTYPVKESKFYNNKNIPVHQKSWVSDVD